LKQQVRREAKYLGEKDVEKILVGQGHIPVMKARIIIH